MNMPTGNVVEFDEEAGQGSIRLENGMTISFQQSQASFRAGDKVIFDIEKHDNAFVAVDVKPTDKRFHL